MVKNRTQTFLLGTLSGAVLAFGVAVLAKHSDPQAAPECPSQPVASACVPAAPSDAPSAPHASGASSAAAPPSADSAQATIPLDVSAPTNVDPQELIGRVKAIAMGQDKHAKLVRIVTSDLTDAGTVDLRAGGFIEYRFEFRRSDSPDNKPGGQILVSVQDAGITTAVTPAADDGAAAETLADPVCSLKAAWKQAIANGPPGAKAHAEYMRHPKSKGSAWMLLAAGTPPYERSVDGLTCAVLDGGPIKKKKAVDDPY